MHRKRADELAGRQVGEPRWVRAWLRVRTVRGWVPITPLGLAVGLGFAWLIRSVALPRQDRVLFMLALCGLVIEALAIALVVVTSLWLRFRPQGAGTTPLEAEAAAPFRTGFAPGWLCWNPLVRVELAWEDPLGARAELVRCGVRLVEEATATGRGSARRVARRFVVADVLHLARVTFVRSRDESITVLPRRGAATHLAPVAQFVAGDQLGHPEGRPQGDLIEMRRYSPGDPLKLVLWKLYARTGRLMVRTPERAVSRAEQTLAFFVAGTDDEPAAGVARAVIEAGSLGNEAIFGADGEPASTRSSREAVEQIVRSTGARSQGGKRLASFLDDGEKAGVTACVLFVPGRPGPWLDRIVDPIASRPGPFRAIVGVDGLRDPARGSLLGRWLLSAQGALGHDRHEVSAIVARLAAAGAEVLVVDRIGGQSFHAHELPDALRSLNRRKGAQ